MERRQVGAAPARGRVGLVAVEREVAERARREHGFGAFVLGHAHVLADHVGAMPSFSSWTWKPQQRVLPA